MNFEQIPDEFYPTAKRNNFKKLKCEIYRDNMQNYKKFEVNKSKLWSWLGYQNEEE